jgi:hypothetical protein
MSDNIHEMRQRLLKMEEKINFIYQAIAPLAKKIKPSEWMSEDEACQTLGWKTQWLRKKNKNENLFNWRNQGGRKGYEYSRAEIEAYKNNFSTIKQ